MSSLFKESKYKIEWVWPQEVFEKNRKLNLKKEGNNKVKPEIDAEESMYSMGMTKPNSGSSNIQSINY